MLAARTLFETMADPAVIVDRDDTVRTANEDATTLRLSVNGELSPALVRAIADGVGGIPPADRNDIADDGGGVPAADRVPNR